MCPLCRVRMYGSENVPKKGPVLVLSNHQSFFDPIFSQAWILRPLLFVARDTLFDIPFFGPLFKSWGTIPIKRGHADLAGIKRIIGALKRGRAVCLYPEATRTYDGRIAEIKPGLGLISRRSGAVVVPMVIEGAFECWPRHKKMPSIGKVVVSYGKPIDPARIKEIGDEKFAVELTEIMREMQNKCRIKLGRKPLDYSQTGSGGETGPVDTMGPGEETDSGGEKGHGDEMGSVLK